MPNSSPFLTENQAAFAALIAEITSWRETGRYSLRRIMDTHDAAIAALAAETKTKPSADEIQLSISISLRRLADLTEASVNLQRQQIERLDALSSSDPICPPTPEELGESPFWQE